MNKVDYKRKVVHFFLPRGAYTTEDANVALTSQYNDVIASSVVGANEQSIGADFHRAIVATVPGENLLIGRRPVRNWTVSSLFFCAEKCICS